MMATNNGTHGVQNDAYAHSSNNSNISALIATRGGSVVVEREVVKGQAAYINKNSDDAYGQRNNDKPDKNQSK